MSDRKRGVRSPLCQVSGLPPLVNRFPFQKGGAISDVAPGLHPLDPPIARPMLVRGGLLGVKIDKAGECNASLARFARPLFEQLSFASLSVDPGWAIVTHLRRSTR